MRIHLLFTVIVLALVFVSGSSVHATRATLEIEYVKSDELITTVAQELSPATADEMKKVFDGQPRSFFADKDPSKFREEQFNNKFTWERFCKVLQREYVLDKSNGCDLNGLLQQPGFYERVRNIRADKTELESLRILRQTYENMQCEATEVQASTHNDAGESNRKVDCRLALTKLNRAVLEAYYPKECPRSPETKGKLVEIGAFFLADFIKPYVKRNEITKVKKFLQAVNQKKLVYGYRSGGGGDVGCYVVDYSIEIKSASTGSDEAGVYMVVTKKHYAGGMCKEWPRAWKTSRQRTAL